MKHFPVLNELPEGRFSCPFFGFGTINSRSKFFVDHDECCCGLVKEVDHLHAVCSMILHREPPDWHRCKLNTPETVERFNHWHGYKFFAREAIIKRGSNPNPSWKAVSYSDWKAWVLSPKRKRPDTIPEIEI